MYVLSLPPKLAEEALHLVIMSFRCLLVMDRSLLMLMLLKQYFASAHPFIAQILTLSPGNLGNFIQVTQRVGRNWDYN